MHLTQFQAFQVKLVDDILGGSDNREYMTNSSCSNSNNHLQNNGSKL
jgi:hypothetical protein